MGERTITVLRLNERDAVESEKDTFETTALVKQGAGMDITPGAARVTVDEVTFRPDEATRAHSHTFGQILHVTGGKGFVEQQDDTGAVVATESVVAGDIVLVPAHVPHRHGATGQNCFTHLAYVLRDEGNDENPRGKGTELVEMDDENL